MPTLRSISMPTPQRPSSSIGSGTRILIPIHLLRCKECHHSDWVTRNQRYLYTLLISYSIPSMVEACLHEGFMTSFLHALSAEVYFRVSLQPAPRIKWTFLDLVKVLSLPPLLEHGIYIMDCSAFPSHRFPWEKLLHSRYLHWAHDYKTDPFTAVRNYARSYHLIVTVFFCKTNIFSM